MKILHLNTLTGGGAAIAARRLHEGLLAEDVQSVFCSAPGPPASWAIQCGRAPARSRVIESLARRWRKRHQPGVSQVTFASDPRTRIHPEQLSAFFPVDVVNLHWIANFLNWETCLPWLSEQAPVVWTLHDMNAFSGIWHYHPNAHENTPRMQRWNQTVLKCKRRALRHIPDNRLTVVAPSRWLAEEARNSELLGRFPIKVIPYGLDTDFFQPVDRSQARTALGLDQNAPLVGFIADGSNDPRKGLSLLVKALQALPSDQRPHLLVVGGDYEGPADFEVTSLGRIQNDRLLRLFYSALDLFACPSLQDNLPNTVIESMACGIPVVAFETGGIPDMVRPGETGWLARHGDAVALSEMIREALGDFERLRSISASCRNVALAEYSLAIQARAYRSIYSELIEE